MMQPKQLPLTKKKKKKKGKDSDDESSVGNVDEVEVAVDKTKKKKKKSKENDDEEDIGAVFDQLTDAFDELNNEPEPSKPNSDQDLMGEPSTRSLGGSVSQENVEKYSVEFFHLLLETIRAKCERKLKVNKTEASSFAMTCHNFYDAWWEQQENELSLAELLETKNKATEDRTKRELIEAQTKYGKELDATVLKRRKWCIKSALGVFKGLKEDVLLGLIPVLVQGAIIAQATPEKLAEFASEDKVNQKHLKKLFGDTELMKEMLLHGGARNYEYGEAMRIYSEIKKIAKSMKDTEHEEDVDEDGVNRWDKLHLKIALAVALEFASPVYEFDSTTKLDPIERYKHFVEAHEAGELDPAFPYFSVWEMRQIVNCDAPNDQMTWCRKMIMNYAPHLTCLTDFTQRYVYLLHSDVRVRTPNWTASPRTYPMILSGGGNESINSWFGRFLLKSFGLPSWGSKFRRKEGFTHWTPDGWLAQNGADWETCSWQGKTGLDFKTEVEARNKAPPEEYFKRLVTLQCLADIVEGDPNQIPDGEKDIYHHERMWRSMAIASMNLLFQTQPGVERTFQREGSGLVVTKCEEYLENFTDDKTEHDILFDEDQGQLYVPTSKHGYKDGNTVVVESFEGGKQINFVADGAVEYEVPANAEKKIYNLICEICTVSSKQLPLFLRPHDEAETIEIEIPYTKGEWKVTESVRVKLRPGATLRFSRPKGSFGLAIRKFYFV